MSEEVDHKNILYPPGGILMWIVISVEVLTFTLALIAFSWERMSEVQLFNSSQGLLSVPMGTANTIILLSSGFFMAEAIQKLKEGNSKKSCFLMIVTMVLGAAFLILKSFEYNEKLTMGIGLGYNSFFTYYWLLTGFHFIHVLVGLVILLFLFFKVRNGFYCKDNILDVESGGAFWHMCDIIWLLIFPVIYLLN
jgi:nitric oxide reductase NorE protein